VKGRPWNHKRVYRIHRELELTLRIKPRKRLKRDKPEPLAVPPAPNLVRLIVAGRRCKASPRGDFMADRLGRSRRIKPCACRAADGRAFRLLNVLERRPAGLCAANAKKDFNREGLGIEVNFSLPTEQVIRSDTLLIEWRGKPAAIRIPYH
jgi:putative transposase